MIRLVVLHSTLFHLQINVTGRCDSNSESIEVTIPGNADISTTREGACLTLTGNGSLELYREILLSARYMFLT